MRKIDLFTKKIDNFGLWFFWISGGILVFLALIMNIEVIIRYFLLGIIDIDWKTTMEFVFETPIITQICLAVLPVAYVLKEESHVSIELITERLSVKTRYNLLKISSAISAVYCGFLVYPFYMCVKNSYLVGERTITLGVPIFLLKAVIVLGFALFSIQFVARTCKYHTLGKGGA